MSHHYFGGSCSGFSLGYRGIFAYTTDLTSLTDAVSDKAAKISVMNMKGHSTIKSPKEFERDV